VLLILTACNIHLILTRVRPPGTIKNNVMTEQTNIPPLSTDGGPQYYQQRNLPNSVAVLVLGICSIFPGCFCMGVVGLVCGIIALVLAKKDMKLFRAEPNAWTISSYNNLNAGRICAIIGVSLSSLTFLFYLVYILLMGMAAITFLPWGNWN
jgi:hypothetical protein